MDEINKLVDSLIRSARQFQRELDSNASLDVSERAGLEMLAAEQALLDHVAEIESRAEMRPT